MIIYKITQGIKHKYGLGATITTKTGKIIYRDANNIPKNTFFLNSFTILTIAIIQKRITITRTTPKITQAIKKNSLKYFFFSI